MFAPYGNFCFISNEGLKSNEVMTRSKSFAKLLPLRKKDSKDLKILQEEDQAKYSTNVLYDASLLAERDF